MFELDFTCVATSSFDSLVQVSKTLLFLRSVLIVFGFQKTHGTLREELYDLYIRLWAAVLYTALFMIAIYCGLLCGYYFGPITLRVYWIMYGF
jgi:hypothetical protein